VDGCCCRGVLLFRRPPLFSFNRGDLGNAQVVASVGEGGSEEAVDDVHGRGFFYDARADGDDVRVIVFPCSVALQSRC